MNIDELLEKHDFNSIQKTTRITKENLQKLISKDFENLNKTQALGFLSILEREYGAIEDLKEDWKEYFSNREENEKILLQTQPNSPYLTSMVTPKDTKPQFVLAGIGLLIVIFVAFMAYDGDTKEVVVPPVPKVVDLNDTSDILDENHTVQNNNEANVTNANSENNTTMPQGELNATSSALKIIPMKKLWFGMVDVATQAKSDQIIDKPFDINLTKPMVIVTSKATFSLQNQNSKKDYRDYKKHYFKIENGILSEITRDQFVLLGGPKKW